MKTVNLIETLKDAPKGIKLYSPLFGDVEFLGIKNIKCSQFIKIKVKKLFDEVLFTSSGQFLADFEDAEPLLFPSKDNRDWNSFKIEPKFPLTYEECCKIVDATKISLIQSSIKYGKALDDLRMLFICRDAWWKIDNDYRPDWKNQTSTKYCIKFDCGTAISVAYHTISLILAFRTSEIRNKFYDTFRDLINNCEEFL